MSWLVTLKFNGDLQQQGFHVTLEVAQDGRYPTFSEDGVLPPNPTLVTHLTEWQRYYADLTSSARALKPGVIQVDGFIHPLLDHCSESAKQLEKIFRQWLKTSSFQELERQLCQMLIPKNMIRVLIRSTDQQLHALPWHLWSFIEEYPNAEIAIGSPRFKGSTQNRTSTSLNAVNVLAVLGNGENIDVKTDHRLLNQLPGAKIKLLVEPTHQELSDQLYDRPWDILFFAGHSHTLAEGQGIIQLNADTVLSIDDLKYGMKRAIANGLQLAIFNSCSGLGLAHALAELQLPQMIVMRQAVPDPVAHTFLKYFLEAFSQGTSLYLAEREARERLQGIETQYPYATWLPIIYQNPAAPPLMWQKRQDANKHPPVRETEDRNIARPSLPRPRKPIGFSRQLVSRIVAISLLSSLTIMGIRWSGLLQPWELSHYDQMLRWRSPELPDSRILIVGANEADLRQYGHPLPDDVLAELLETLEEYQPNAIGLDIIRDQPVLSKDGSSGYQALTHQFQTNPNLITGCAFGSQNLEAIAPPPQSPLEQIGFLNLHKDSRKRTVRRHLLSHKLPSPSICNTYYSFPLQLLGRYINNSDGRLTIDVTPGLDWQITDTVRDRSVVFRRLSARSGGYQNFEAGGNQSLINYRLASNLASQVSVRDVLEGKVDSSWIKDRIVLIGVVASSIQDDHATPIGQLRGVQLHAQVLSQFLSAIEDNRPLIRWLPQWFDFLVVLQSTLVGAFSLIGMQKELSSINIKINLLFIISFGFYIFIIYSISNLILKKYGLWLPVIPSILSILITACIIRVINNRNFLDQLSTLFREK
ncbi:MAG: CHASE2 domain-containing protein [Cyanobacteria bacterium P01_F01_bin.150]